MAEQFANSMDIVDSKQDGLAGTCGGTKPLAKLHEAQLAEIETLRLRETSLRSVTAVKPLGYEFQQD
ncbi:hypothetical protein N7457_005900 [Penicillium paradoxum]|uniref:uncharacterized protein n=1 Tax=Penicillium paradoxum TaxID=176176 RepID=UPI002546F0DB|nr:uncharacterized protein N7457_005900 [Penicillium paradoxum]KAJ5780740.1 hypothetical protein N7457_005900 [Penicillium paradoxum]